MGNVARARVLLVDDHALFRRGLAGLLRTAPDFEVVGEAADGLDAIAQARSLQPDVILMDVRMPRLNGLEATRQILDGRPQTRILMLSMAEDEDAVFEAVKSGAQGYLLKTAGPDELFDALRGLLRGELPLSGDLAVKLLGEFARRVQESAVPAPHRTPLCQREKDVLALAAEGKSNPEIAAALGVTETTVTTCITAILEKLHPDHRA